MPNIPLEYDGAGIDKMSSTIVTEELWCTDPRIGSAGFGTDMVIEFGDE